jgi:hypothetical protein
VLSKKILVPVLSKWVVISLSFKKAYSKRFKVSNTYWSASGCYSGDTTFD